MKAILLAGGTGTRLRPLTGLMNKHMLPVYQYPMIHYAIHTLAEAGADEILLVTGRQSAGLFIDYLGSGEAFGARLTYLIQEQAGGIAQALDLAKPFIAPQEKFLMLLGDNLVEDSLKPYVEAYRGQEPGTAMVLLKEVPDPHRYGVPVFDSEGGIAAIEEKPANPATSYSVTGIYLYDGSVFDIVAVTQPSGRGELEITDVNNAYARQGKLRYEVLPGWWTDAGTFDSLHEAAGWMKDRMAAAGAGRAAGGADAAGGSAGTDEAGAADESGEAAEPGEADEAGAGKSVPVEAVPPDDAPTPAATEESAAAMDASPADDDSASQG
ncbi:sugar phosphate nucleotidyltransferase [Paenibacillus pasadenensis]|uniref:Glucose-1-phosphate thymidylyltransferase n=1 Tax=Paenibacillus pasadenensis TaxID=217090 RepID=A0A2N5N469_9BACL|nr:sugar phosphate nucleotidyltransferase [Paenibacillus pasadenensis]PLT45146.1 Glucose-1-phosphate thymidylyltransferase [Paenibacillus pasadenensis]